MTTEVRRRYNFSAGLTLTAEEVDDLAERIGIAPADMDAMMLVAYMDELADEGRGHEALTHPPGDDLPHPDETNDPEILRAIVAQGAEAQAIIDEREDTLYASLAASVGLPVPRREDGRPRLYNDEDEDLLYKAYLSALGGSP